MNPHIGALGIDGGAFATRGTEAITDRIFDGQADEFEAAHRRFDAVGFDFDGAFHRKISRPINFVGQLVEVFFVTIIAAAQAQQNTAGDAAM